MPKKIDYSFCIVNWNGGDTLIRCLDSIEREISSSKNLVCEIILVDNNSDDVDSILLQHFPHVKLIRNPSNTYFAVGTNQSVKHASGKIVILLNNDIELQSGFLKNLHLILMKKKTIDLLVPTLFYPSGELQKSISGLPTYKDLLSYAFFLQLLGGRFSHWQDPEFDYTHEQLIQTTLQPAFSALVIKNECWRAVGELDEDFPLLWNDVDWFYRFHHLNQAAFYSPKLKVTHQHGFSVNKHRYKKILTSTIAMRKYMQKHHPVGWVKTLFYDLVYVEMLLLRLLREAFISVTS